MPATDEFGDLVVVIPGILGSRLVRRETGKTVWDFSIAALPQLLKQIGTSGLALPPNDATTGLVARYFCEHLGGAEHTRALITLGTPHRGSVRALDVVVNGLRVGPFDLTPILHDWKKAATRGQAQRKRGAPMLAKPGR